MPADNHDARMRLGELLAARRVEIDPRYADRMLFAVERLGSRSKWRTLFDMENAKRARFKPGTLRALEGAYRLEGGSLDRFDGELEPLPADAPRLTAVPVPAPPGAGLGALDRIAAIYESATPAERVKLDAMVVAMIEGDEVAEGLWRFPDPRGPSGRLLPPESRFAFIRTWLAFDPRRVLDDEDRHRGTGA